MILELVLTILFQTSLVLGLALVGMRLAAKSPAGRVLIGRLTFVLVVALAGYRVLVPNQPSHWARVELPVSTPVFTPTYVEVRNESPVVESTSSAKVSAASIPTLEPERYSPGELAVLTWLTGCGLLGLWSLAGIIRLRNLKSKSMPLQQPEVRESLRNLEAELRVQKIDAWESSRISTVFVAGFLRPSLYFPSGWSPSPECVRAVLTHEIAHVTNRDLPWLFFTRLVSIALWPNPLVWILGRMLRQASEELSDLNVLNVGFSPEQYANFLLDQQSLLKKMPPSMAYPTVSKQSALRKRIVSIMNTKIANIVRLSRFSQLRIAAVLATITVAASVVVSQSNATDAPLLSASYATSVNVLDAKNQKPLQIDRATLVVMTNTSQASAIKLVSVGNEVTIPQQDAKFTHGVLFVEAAGNRSEFITLWPTSKAVTSLSVGESQTIHRKLETTFPLQAGTKIRPGRLVHLKGSLGWFQMPDWMSAKYEASVSPKGEFSMVGLPAGALIDFDISPDKYALMHLPVRTDQLDKPQTVLVKNAAQITGTVLRNGEPVPNVRVSVQGHQDGQTSVLWGQDFTDKDGRYVMKQLTPGIYNVSIGLPSALETEVTARAHERVVLKSGDALANFDFQLEPGSQIYGILRDSAGNPLPNAYVGIQGPAHPSTSAEVQVAKANAQGEYTARVPAGTHTIYCMDSRWESDLKKVKTEEGARVQHDIYARVRKLR